MANYTEDQERQERKTNIALTRTLTVATGDTIYKDVLASIDASGNLAEFDTSLLVAGISVEQYAAGEEGTVNFGNCVWFDKSDASAEDVGKTAEATDDYTVKIGTSTSVVGPIVEWRSEQVLVWMTLRA